MQDENSLLNEVKRIIGIRKEHEALQSKAKVEFLYAEENDYPLVYKRVGIKEEILVIINPANRTVKCEISSIHSRSVVYAYHGEASLVGKHLEVPPCSFTIMKISDK